MFFIGFRPVDSAHRTRALKERNCQNAPMKLRAPNVFVLIFSILVLVGALTWVLPAGKFDRATKTLVVAGVEEQREVIVPGSYKTMEQRHVEANPGTKEPAPDHRQRVWHWFMAPIKGFQNSAEVIGFILLVGGAFGVLNKTGAIMAFLTWITAHAKGAGRYAMIPGLMFLFSLGGSTFGMAEETIAFILITVPLAVSLGFDVATGVAIPFIGSQAGFAAAFINPFTLGIAKGIADAPMEDGFGYRIICWFVVTGFCAAFVTWHAIRVAKDPSKSPTPNLDASWRQTIADSPDEAAGLTGPHKMVLTGFVAAMLALAVGAIQYHWYIMEMCGLFLGMALLCGLLGRLRLGEIADSLVDGAKDLAPAALLVAFARGIKMVADDGHIIDTMLLNVSHLIKDMGPVWSAECMYAVQSFFNFFVPSGSGQAALTMPIMVPLADLVHVSRENTILAYQFGDGLSNIIIPTNAVLIGVLTMAKMSYGVWFRWILPFQILLLLLGGLLLAIGTSVLPSSF